MRARALGHWLKGHTRCRTHDAELDRLVGSANLLARNLMSALPGTQETNPNSLAS